MSALVINRADRAEILEALHELGWSQNKLARKIRRSHAMVSKVLHGHVVSAPVWRLMTAAIERERQRRKEWVG